jgi:hypothetical protein
VLLEGWFRYDGNWYELIVTRGYSLNAPGQQANVAFFPAYPLLVRVVDVVVRDAVLAGILVTALAGCGAVVLFHRWCCERVGPDLARAAVAVLLAYPYVWYLFGAVYADAVFLAAALGAFVLLDRGHPVWAGLAGVVATAARPVGVAVVLGLVAVTLQRAADRPGPPARGLVDRWRGRLRWSDAAVLTSIGGLAAWSTYLWVRFDDPLLFSKIQGASGWDQEGGPHTWFKVTLVDNIRHLPQWIGDAVDNPGIFGYSPWSSVLYTLGTVFQGLLVLGAFLLVPRIARRLGWGYALYVAAVMGIPLLGSKDFQGCGRYLLAAFPVFLVVAQALEPRPALRRAALVGGTLALVLLTSLYARGYYVA